MHTDSLIDDLEVVSAADPALDMSDAERIRYVTSRDPKVIKDQPGCASRRYILRALTSSELMAIESLEAGRKVMTAFLMGVKEIRNYPSAGVVASPSQASPVPSDSTRRIWTDKEFTSLTQNLGGKRIYEIGRVVYDRALEGNGEGGSIYFEPLPLLLEELARTARRRAVLLMDSAGGTPST